VLPGQAEAVVNFRILPGDTIESVQAYVKQTLADDRIKVEVLGPAFNPSRLSSSQTDAFKLIERTVREVFPDSIVAPGLMLAASDARLRFMPIRFNSDDLTRVHGTDERIATRQLADMVRFYHRLLQQAAGTSTSTPSEGTKP
jgi:carboxypeptidase PM20D1